MPRVQVFGNEIPPFLLDGENVDLIKETINDVVNDYNLKSPMGIIINVTDTCS